MEERTLFENHLKTSKSLKHFSPITNNNHSFTTMADDDSDARASLAQLSAWLHELRAKTAAGTPQQQRNNFGALSTDRGPIIRQSTSITVRARQVYLNTHQPRTKLLCADMSSKYAALPDLVRTPLPTC
jgi:hypothetical protein